MNHYSTLDPRHPQPAATGPIRHGQGEPYGVESRPLPPDQRLTLTIPEACQVLGIGETMLRQMIRVERLPILRIGRRVLIPRQAVEALVAGACGEPRGTPGPIAWEQSAASGEPSPARERRR